MAGEIRVPVSSLPTKAAATLLNQNSQFWNTGTSAFEAYNAANIEGYAIALTVIAGTCLYIGDAPAGLPAGVYEVIAWKVAGANLATLDLLEEPAGGDPRFEWGGSAVVSLYSRLAPAVEGRTVNVSESGAITLVLCIGGTC
jgi:hypothetical protein